jgi:hypothetical protein
MRDEPSRIKRKCYLKMDLIDINVEFFQARMGRTAARRGTYDAVPASDGVFELFTMPGEARQIRMER